jgi:putative ABC transport system permease protein
VTFLDTLATALHSLRANGLRSLLTMLGMVIGVAAVIAMTAVGAGARDQIMRQINSLGGNLILMGQGSVARGGVRLGAGAAATLTEDDAAAIAREIDGVEQSGPAVRWNLQVVAGNQNWNTQMHGVTPDYVEARAWRMAAGRTLTIDDVAQGAKVAVLGKTVVDNLFGGGDPVGQSIRIFNTPLTVVGMFAEKGQGPQGNDQDDVLYLPLTTAKRYVPGIGKANPKFVHLILVNMAQGSDMKEAERQITGLLRQRHRLADGQENDFWIRIMSEVTAAKEESAAVLSFLLAAVAGVSLLVGGVGIMNIMLVSVTERTREIGLRLAVGARRRDVLRQFLLEATLLSGLGALIGVALGVGAAAALSDLAGWPTLVQPAAVLVAVGVSVAVGIVFGWYPARRAAQLDPIVALRRD